MILVTIGTQLPFDRLVRIIDELAPTLDEEVFAQIGQSSYQPVNISWTETLSPQLFDSRFAAARVIVSHAGIGTVLTAQKHAKPIILFPREARFGEHRNDHQLATCRQLEGRPGIFVAKDGPALSALLMSGNLLPSRAGQELASRQQLIAGLQSHFDRLGLARGPRD